MLTDRIILGAVMLALSLAALMPMLVGVEIAAVAMGLGIGCLYPIFTIATQNAAGSERMGAAIGSSGSCAPWAAPSASPPWVRSPSPRA